MRRLLKAFRRWRMRRKLARYRFECDFDGPTFYTPPCDCPARAMVGTMPHERTCPRYGR